uniref:Ubiquitin-like domain-containing protein n=1 Tax=Moniliophthora roreri TaxID=221103 RepID=A0A0W0FYF9_MONRR
MGFKFMDWFEKNLKGKLNRRKKSPSDTSPATPTSTFTNATTAPEGATKLPSVQPATSQSTSGSAVKDVTVPTISPHLPSGITNNEAISESVKTVSKVVAAAGEAVPVVGPIIKGTIGAILEVLTVIDQISDNNEEILLLTWDLRDLICQIEDVPVAVLDKNRDRVHEELLSLYRLLDQLQRKQSSNFAPEKVSQTLQMIQNRMDRALNRYGILSTMEIKQMMSKSPIAATVTIIDAAGRSFPFPAGLLLQQESMHRHLENLFLSPEEGDERISGMLLDFVKQGQYSLSIANNNRQVVMLGSGEEQWLQLEPGTKIVMSAILRQEKEKDFFLGYRCPVCNTWNGIQDYRVNAARDCSNQECSGRFQAFEEGGLSMVRENKRQNKNRNTSALRNIHIIQTVMSVSTECYKESLLTALDLILTLSDECGVRVSTECHNKSMLTVLDLILTLSYACFHRVSQQILADCSGLDSDSQDEVCVSTECHNRSLLTVLDLILTLSDACFHRV